MSHVIIPARAPGGGVAKQRSRRREHESGYVLLGIIIASVILGIFMAAAVPVWQHVIQREKEEELIWRGRQYVQAIERYQRKFPGAYPPKLEILVEQKFLRKLYKDPMTEDGEWKIIRQLSPEVRTLPGQARGAAQVGSGAQRSISRRPLTRRPTTPSSGSQRGIRRRGDQGLGGIVGVASKSEEESIRVLDGKQHYNEWLFVYAAQGQGPQGPQATRRPGVPGQQRQGGPAPPRTGRPPRPRPNRQR
ncbi:MAG: Tfp pilus assembly protein FimT/FimU [Acidobacteriota bacterium]